MRQPVVTEDPGEAKPGEALRCFTDRYAKLCCARRKKLWSFLAHYSA